MKCRINVKVMTASGTWIDWQYLLDAATLLAKCRYTLQYTYPYAYYMEPGPRKELVCNISSSLTITPIRPQVSGQFLYILQLQYNHFNRSKGGEPLLDNTIRLTTHGDCDLAIKDIKMQNFQLKMNYYTYNYELYSL